ncbi:hypothetical protein [Streptomyces sp. NPDC088707]|uniref:hypothetical protein n=1 Tax=Streptomyces sp. NPDC088707 TaxID=3365871 RepID=UPI00382F1AFC
MIGDGAVGLLAVLSAKRLDAQQTIIMGRHQARTDLGRELGATEVVSVRGEEGIEAVREPTRGHGTSHARLRTGPGRRPPQRRGQPRRRRPV